MTRHGYNGQLYALLPDDVSQIIGGIYRYMGYQGFNFIYALVKACDDFKVIGKELLILQDGSAEFPQTNHTGFALNIQTELLTNVLLQLCNLIA